MNQEQEELVKEVREKAKDYFKRGDFFCSGAVLTTVNELLGAEVPSEMVKLASGFPVGIGKSKCLCECLRNVFQLILIYMIILKKSMALIVIVS